jgi:Icc-related predicted phosphoesterase
MALKGIGRPKDSLVARSVQFTAREDRKVRVLFATDLHGSTRVLQKALRCSAHFEVDYFLLGGDLSGKWLLPIVRKGKDIIIFEPAEKAISSSSDGRGKLLDQSYVFRPTLSRNGSIQEELTRLESKGYYWHFFDSEEEVYSLESRHYDELQRAAISERLNRWSKMIAKGLSDGQECFWTGGNDDEQTLLDEFRASGDDSVFTYAEGQCIHLSEDLNLLSVGYSNRTPFDTARELDEPDLLAELRRVHANAGKPPNLVLNVHVPPKNCGSLDIGEGGPRGIKEHVGSTAVRQFIEETKPIAVFSGHIHEGRGMARIGPTVVFNPGSAYNSGALLAFVVTLDRNGVLDQTHIVE